MLYAVPSAAVNTPAPQATVSASVTLNTQVCVHPLLAKFRLLRPTNPFRVDVATEPPVIVTLVNVAAPVFNIFALPSAKAIEPHQEFPSVSV